MDLVDRIAHSEFLGREFLLYLWWKSETEGGDFALADGRVVTLSLESHLVLERKIRVVEKTALKGPVPTATRMAKDALRHGEMPTSIALRITHEERDYAFTLSDRFTLRSVHLPALLTEQEDEPFIEEMALLEALESMLDELFVEMMRARMDPASSAHLVARLRAFAHEGSERA